MTNLSLHDLEAIRRRRAQGADGQRLAIRAALGSVIDGSPDMRALQLAIAQDADTPTGRARSARTVMTMRPKTDAEVAQGIDVRGRHPGAAALRLANEVLGDLGLPPYRLTFNGVHRTAGAGAFETTEGFVMIGVHFTPPNDIRETVELPFAVKAGRLLPPGVMLYHGQVRVLSQPAFDDILKRGELYQRVHDRSSVFGVPPPGRRTLPTIPIQRPGLFGKRTTR